MNLKHFTDSQLVLVLKAAHYIKIGNPLKDAMENHEIEDLIVTFAQLLNEAGYYHEEDEE